MKKYIFLLICVLICFVSCADYEANVTGKLHVITIGLNYENTGVSPLNGPVNDATEFGAAMSVIMNEKGIPRSITYMLQEGEVNTRDTYPTKDNVLKAIASVKANSNDMLTVFYSGHGQNVWWTKCSKCGQEYSEFVGEEETKPGEVCFVCNNNYSLFKNLTICLSETSGSLAQSARNYLAGELPLDAYITALKSANSATANEILAVSDYSEPSYALLTYKQRGFFVVAPEEPLAFQDFAKNYVNDNTLFGAIAKRMQTDLALPNANAYKNDSQGYYKALLNRLGVYGCTASDIYAFERYWNLYQFNYWQNHLWTALYMDELADLLETKGCRALLLADACYSGFAVNGRDEDEQNLGDAFARIFSSGDYRNLTVVSSSSFQETSANLVEFYTEDGYKEGHGMFALKLFEQLNWKHSKSSYSQVKIDDTVRKIYGYLSSVPNRLTMNEAMEKIRKSWSYTPQTPQMNSTYLDTILIP